MKFMSLLIVVLASWVFAPAAPSAANSATPNPDVGPGPVATVPAEAPSTVDMTPPQRPGVHIDGPATADQRARVAEAVASFEAAGLEIPSTLVRFGGDEGACSEHMGLFSASDTQTIISICSELPFVVTHELAHVWIHENLDEAAQQSYIDARELPTWRSRDFDWNERGVEDAAFVMQQVLMFGEDRSTSASWQERVAAFGLLTGTQV